MEGYENIANIANIARDKVTTTMIPDPFACAELGCHYLEAGDLAGCEKERHCPFSYQRRREESAIEIAAKDAKAKENL